MPSEELLPGYWIDRSTGLERSLLVKFMQRTYREFYGEDSFGHLALTVEQYFSPETPLWWVQPQAESASAIESKFPQYPVGCLWLGNAIDQVRGDRHTHVFLLYVNPDHRRRGVGSALMRYAETYARHRGDRQIGLQVFQFNQPALNLYEKLGYRPQSIWMVKPLT